MHHRGQYLRRSLAAGITCGATLVPIVLVACGGGSSTGDASEQATAGADASSPVITVTLNDAGCTPSDFTLHQGTIIFSVTNSGSTAVEEMEVADQQGHVRGDVEGVAPGQTKSFVLDLRPGTYLVRCPQTATHTGTLTVT